MGGRTKSFMSACLAIALAAFTGSATAHAQTNDLSAAFDGALGTQLRSPQTFDAVYETSFERRIAQLADGSQGRIGIAAIDLATGRQIAVLGDPLFPMASTSKIAEIGRASCRERVCKYV